MAEGFHNNGTGVQLHYNSTAHFVTKCEWNNVYQLCQESLVVVCFGYRFCANDARDLLCCRTRIQVQVCSCCNQGGRRPNSRTTHKVENQSTTSRSNVSRTVIRASSSCTCSTIIHLLLLLSTHPLVIILKAIHPSLSLQLTISTRR